jgi:hypothetical protein
LQPRKPPMPIRRYVTQRASVVSSDELAKVLVNYH